MNSKEDPIMLPQMCDKHQSILVHDAGFAEGDPWQVLIVLAQVSLFQAAAGDEFMVARCKGDLKNLPEYYKCLACAKPDVFGECVEAAKTKNLDKVKEVGDKYVQGGK